MNLQEYMAGIEKLSGQPMPEGTPGWVKVAERYAETLRAIQERTPTGSASGIQHPDNRVSRALFTAETGIKLPKTQRDSLAVLVAYVGAERVADEQRAKDEREAAERAERQRQRIESIRQRFAGGATVTGAELVDAARAAGCDVHPRTAGVLIRKVVGIKRDGSCSVRPGTRPNGHTLWPVIRAVAPLYADPHDDRHADAETQDVAESLFQPGGTLVA